jgi:hypothetical protein
MANMRHFFPAVRSVLVPMAKRALTRRNLLRYGGGLALLAGGFIAVQGVRNRIWETGAGPAYEPWLDWNSDRSHTLMPLVRAGILAANNLNTQPWQFAVRSHSILVYADASRALSQYDPFMRELWISLGCAIENMDLTARALGFTPTVQYATGRLPGRAGADGRILAAKIGVQSSRRRHLKRYAVIPSRRTNRGPFKDRAVRHSFLEKLTVIGGADPDISLTFYERGGGRKQIDDLILSASRDMVLDTAMMTERRAWLRLGQDAIEKHRDGPTIDTMGLHKLPLAFAKMLPDPDAAAIDEAWFERVRNVQLATAPAIGVISVRDPYDKSQCMRLGRLWQKIHLTCTLEHMAVQPMTQPFKMVDRELQRRLDPRHKRLIDDLVGDVRWHGVFAFRIGRAEREAYPSPRRAAKSVVIG